MRTTVSISDRVLTQAKRVAASSCMPTYAGQGVLAGVDLDDSAGLQDLMDQSTGIDRLR
jgi:hypothetical protein